jgi:hypothetical protein
MRSFRLAFVFFGFLEFAFHHIFIFGAFAPIRAVFVSPRPLLLPSGWAIAASVQLSAAPAVSFQFSFDLMIQRILE